MSKKGSILCKILFTAFVAALILMFVPDAKVKADIEDPVVFEVSFDGAQSFDEYEVYYALKPVSVTPGAVTWTKVEGEFTDGEKDGYFVDSGDDWAMYGVRFYFENITGMTAINQGDEVYIKVVTKSVNGKPAKTIMYGNARRWNEAINDIEEKNIIGDGADANYNFTEDTESMSLASCTYEIKADLGDFETYNALNFGLAYPRQGDTRAKEYIEGDIFAYGDIDASGAVNADDIKKGIAVDLCRKYFWEEGGILSEYYEIRNPEDILDSKKLYSDEDRLTVTSNGTVSAYDKDGSATSIDKYTYSLELGYDCYGNYITASGVAYGLDSTEKVLIQAGDKLYIRDVVRDNEEDPGDEVAFGNYGETPAVCVVVDNFNNIKFGGNGVSTNYDMTYNPDGSTVLCAYMMNDDFANKYNDTIGRTESHTVSSWSSNRSSFLRIIDKNNRYVIVENCDGSKSADGIQKDPVCMTGDSAYVETFAGYKELKITSLASNLGCTYNQDIKDVKLKDRSMSKGVRINPINTENPHEGFKVTFKSNFYDEIPLEITYEDNYTQTLIIKRIALVVRYVYLGDPDVDPTANFCYDFVNNDSQVAYNYGAGEQILIYAQYYHTDDANTDLSLFLTREDGSTQVINKDTVGRANGVYTKAATEDCVAETYFLLDFAPAHNEWGESIDNQNVGAWDAMVLNAGYNGSNSFGGAQFGSGTGFHWDGRISWQY